MTLPPLAGIRVLLAEPGYRRVWLIGGLTGLARWLEILAFGIYAVETTGSPFLVALLMILRMAPMALFGPLVGALADRLDRRRMLLLSLALAIALAVVMLALSATGLLVYWHVAAAAFLSGILWATDMPLRRRIVGDVAGAGRVAAAMSLDSGTSNSMRLLGPLLGGVLYQGLGLGGVFALGAVVPALSLWLALDIRRQPQSSDRSGGGPAASSPLRHLAEAFTYALGDKEVLRILGITVVFNIWGFAFISMVPVIGEAELGLEPGWIGVLSSLEGLGAFAGTLVVGWVAGTSGLRYRRLYYFGILAYLILVFLIGWSATAGPPAALLVAALLVAVGVACVCFSAMQSTLIYVVAPPEMRSRMFGLLTISIGTGLIGALNVGLMAEAFGAAAALRIIAVEGLIPLILIGLRWRALRS